MTRTIQFRSTTTMFPENVVHFLPDLIATSADARLMGVDFMDEPGNLTTVVMTAACPSYVGSIVIGLIMFSRTGLPGA